MVIKAIIENEIIKNRLGYMLIESKKANILDKKDHDHEREIDPEESTNYITKCDTNINFKFG